MVSLAEGKKKIIPFLPDMSRDDIDDDSDGASKKRRKVTDEHPSANPDNRPSRRSKIFAPYRARPTYFISIE